MEMKDLEVDYSKNETPKGYKCGKCGKTHVKLWRYYQTFLEHQDLLCAKCAGEEQGVDVSSIDKDGLVDSRYGRTDQISSRIPAVPTEDGTTFWGYTSVPWDGIVWWKNLPSI